MKRFIISIFTLCVWALSLHAQNGEFDPANPGDPQPFYVLQVQVSPSAGGTANITRTLVAEGQEIAIRVTPSANFRLEQWVCGEEVLSSDSYLYYTMPARNVTITAQMVYDPNAFDPESPGDPEGQGEVVKRHKVTVYCSPSIGGYTNQSLFYMQEGEQRNLYAYNNAGYAFVGWMQDGIVFSQRNPMLIDMGDKDLTYTAVFSFNPESPDDPNVNSFDVATGTLVVDHFAAGRLSSAVRKVLGDNSYSDIHSATIIGAMDESDFGVLLNLSSCSFIDISRTDGFAAIPSWTFSNLTSLTSLVLPSSVEQIEKNAFYGSNNISEIILYAIAPPEIEENALESLSSSVTVRVPASALGLYQTSTDWSRFNLVSMDAQTLTVSLPEDAQDGRYKNMTLELENQQSGQIQKYLITERSTYTFLNLFNNSNYVLSVHNSRGMLLGSIDNIVIENQDVSVTFDTLLMPINLTLKIVTPEGEDITSSSSVTWLDEKGNYLQKGSVLSNVIEGITVFYNVTLNAEKSSLYEELSKESIVINKEQELIEKQVTKRSTITLSGTVVSSTSLSPVKGIYVSIAQSLKGKNSNVYFTETDKDGHFSVEVLNANTTLYFTDNSYLKHTLILDTTQLGNLDTIKIQPLTGTTLYVKPQYKASVLRGNVQEVINSYADYANIDFSVYNVTQSKPMQAVVKFPFVTLPEKIVLGDSLTLTTTSRNHKFNSSVDGARIDSTLYAQINVPITQLGAVHATYQQADVDEVAALLFDNRGNLIQKQIFDRNQEAKFEYVDDGNYMVVCLENLRPFNNISRLSEFVSSALIAGTDYLQEPINVNSGWISTIQFDSVALINRALLYAGENMQFSSTSTQTTIGNHVTLKAKVDLKKEEISNISDIRFIFDMPENTEFVNGSVMVGGSVYNNYTISEGRLIVPIQNTSQQIAFCITPLQEGRYSPCAYAQFKVANEDLQFPIASAYYEVKGLTLEIPNVVATKTIKVGGTAIPNSIVEVYADDELIGTSRSNSNGSWSADCSFRNPANLAIMKVYASTVDKNGVKYVSETYDCQYDRDAIEVSKVTMYHRNPEMGKTYEVVFDFQNPNNKPASYVYYIYNKVFTFDIDFNVNDTNLISDVMLYVKTGHGTWTSLSANFNPSKRKWVAEGKFGNMYDGNIPVNVAVDFHQNITYKLDDDALDAQLSGYNDLITEYQSLNRRIADYSEMIDLELSHDSIDYGVVDSLMALIDNSPIESNILLEDSLHNLTDEEFWRYCDQLQIELAAKIESYQNVCDTIDNVLQNNWSIYGVDTLYLYELGYKMIVSIEPATIIQETDLITNGYTAIPTTNGNTVYEYLSDTRYHIVDFTRNYSQTIEYILDDGINNQNYSKIRNGKNKLNSDQLIDQVCNTLNDVSTVGGALVENTDNQLDKDIAKADAAYKEARWRPGESAENIKNLHKQKNDLKAAKGKVGNFGKLCNGAGYLSTLGGSLKLRSAFLALQEEIGRIPYPPCMTEVEAAQWASELAYLNNEVQWGYIRRVLRDAGEELLNTGLSHLAGAGAAALVGGGTAAGVTAGTAGVGVGVGVAAGAAAGSAAYIGASAVAHLGTTAIMNGINDFVDDRYFSKMRSDIENLHRFAAQKEQSCEKEKPKEPKGKKSGNQDARHSIDPSGFVYEGVEDNRVEGVTATIFYKDSVTNEYGERAEMEIMWDASEFDQENPLYTDENGFYQWFVPQGMWQVRFEKEGYEPTQSEWLPVPPPQLEVNIPIVQLRQPEVINAIAHKNAIDITFDKYMMPSLLNTDNVFVTANGQNISGTLTLLDEQHSYGEESATYASKIRFVPESEFTAREITLTVSNRVRSYADVPMAQTFQQTFDVQNIGDMERVQTPIPSIPSGSQVEPGTELAISCATEGAVIRYTMDGTVPDCLHGYIYATPIILSGQQSVTIHAIACADGYDPSEMAEWVYTFGKEEALEQTNDQELQVTKMLQDGHLYILMPDGSKYTILGQKVR